jgi:indole-3-glycerol phosphate synthase
MVKPVPDILTRIVEHKRAELAQAPVPRAEWELQGQNTLSARRDFRAALLARRPAIIAEIKKASPSKGVLAAEFDPAKLALRYEQGGAAALSVLTDQKFFQGSLADLAAARAATALPALRKDFTIGEYHVAEAAAHGADAILLIAAILTTQQLRDLRKFASQFHMASLVEVHDSDDLARALDSGAQILGVNNRNLHTFQVSLETSLKLAEHIPPGILKVSESGIESAGDIRLLQTAGFDAFLIGERLMKASNPTEALRALTA